MRSLADSKVGTEEAEAQGDRAVESKMSTITESAPPVRRSSTAAPDQLARRGCQAPLDFDYLPPRANDMAANKPLIRMARPERFELPAPRFVVGILAAGDKN